MSNMSMFFFCFCVSVMDESSLLMQLFQYVMSGDSQSLEYFLHQMVGTNPQFVNMSDSRGRTALHIACNNSNEQVISILLHYGARCDLQDINGNTPLHLAAVRANSKIMSMLLESPCNKCIWNKIFVHLTNFFSQFNSVAANANSMTKTGTTPIDIVRTRLNRMKTSPSNVAANVEFQNELHQLLQLLINFLQSRDIEIPDQIIAMSGNQNATTSDVFELEQLLTGLKIWIKHVNNACKKNIFQSFSQLHKEKSWSTKCCVFLNQIFNWQ